MPGFEPAPVDGVASAKLVSRIAHMVFGLRSDTDRRLAINRFQETRPGENGKDERILKDDRIDTSSLRG